MSSGTCSHQDESRSKVGTTALGVAALRALETDKGELALITDPYARYMAGTEGFAWIKQLEINKPDVAVSMVDGLAIRTKKIDDELMRYFTLGIEQMVVPGAGLDCRPWRIHHSFDQLHVEHLKSVSWYELDFPEMLNYKLQQLGKNAESMCKRYEPIHADLSLPNWSELLIARSFNITEPSIWLLEGFTSYLTREELTLFLQSVSALTAPSSILIATFITEGTAEVKNDLHRSFYQNPPEFLSAFGWETVENNPIVKVGEIYNRVPKDPKVWANYRIVIAKKK